MSVNPCVSNNMQIKLYSRKCPKCPNIITYKTWASWQSSTSRNSTCMECRPTKPKLSGQEQIARKIELKKYNKKYRDSHKAELLIKKREYLEKIKLEGIQKYGGKCDCCGEKEPRFLTLEHIGGRKNGDNLTGKKAWAKVKSLGYPDDYTVLCFNCNCCKGAYGECAHKKK